MSYMHHNFMSKTKITQKSSEQINLIGTYPRKAIEPWASTQDQCNIHMHG
jgi:hypothetical protein